MATPSPGKNAAAVNPNLNMGSQVLSLVGRARQVKLDLEQQVNVFAHMTDGVNDYAMVATALGLSDQVVAKALVTVINNANAALAASADFNLMCDAIISSL